jgi:hypothetical protein
MIVTHRSGPRGAGPAGVVPSAPTDEGIWVVEDSRRAQDVLTHAGNGFWAMKSIDGQRWKDER